MLNIARARFILASQAQADRRGEGGSKKRVSRKTPPAIMKLETGPTTATSNSVEAFIASFSINETPPKMNNVIDLTGSRLASARRLCDISCASNDRKNRALVASVVMIGAYGGHPACSLEYCAQNESVIIPNRKNHEKFIPISIPNNLAIIRLDLI